MPNFIISLSKNKLKVSYVVGVRKSKSPSSEVYTQVFELPSEVANDTRVVDALQFSHAISDAINQISTLSNGHVRSKHPSLVFLIEPQDEILKFVTVNKRDGEREQQVINDIKTKIGDKHIEDLYFTYTKIAPFVYQFVGVEKSLLDKYLEVSNLLQAELKGVFPWVMLLPKYTGNVDPSIYVSNNDGRQVVALSELGGIYYSAAYTDERSTAELEKLVHELSIYKRSTPINKIYSLDEVEFSLDPTFTLVKLSFDTYASGLSGNDLLGFESHLVLDNALSKDPELMFGPENLLNLLPLPVVQKKNTALVYVGGGVALLLLLLGIFMFTPGLNKLLNKGDNVLSENSVVTPTPVVTAEPSVTPIPSPALDKKSIKIRVENGSGIPGAAAKGQSFLVGLGYDVPEIGNADESNRSNTLVKIKTSKIAYKDMLISDMKTGYELVVEDGLAESESYDVLVVVGQN